MSKYKVDFFILFHNVGNNQQDVAVPFCGTSLANSPGLLYQFTTDIDISSVDFDTCNNADYDTKIAVFQVRSTLLANTRVILRARKQVALYTGLPSLLGSELTHVGKQRYYGGVRGRGDTEGFQLSMSLKWVDT